MAMEEAMEERSFINPSITECISSNDEDEFVDLEKVLEKFRINKVCTDAVIVCGEKKIPVHRAVLSAACKYFRCMFASGMKESTTVEVTMEPGLEPEAMDILIKYWYDDSSLPNFDDDFDTAEAVLKASHYFNVKKVLKHCWKTIIYNHLNRKTCIDILTLAELFGVSKIQETCMEYTVANFEKAEDLDVALKCLHAVVFEKLLKNLRKANCSGDLICRKIIIWVEDELKKREEHLLDLFKTVEFDDVSNECLVEMTEMPLISSNFQVFAMLLNILLSRLPSEDLKIREDNEPWKSKRRIPKNFQVHCVGKESIRTYSFADNLFTVQSGFGIGREIRKFETVVGCSKCLYFITGKKVVKYNPEIYEWSEVANMNISIKKPFTTECNGKLYVGNADAFERYDPETNEWESLGRLKNCNGPWLFLVTLNGQVFVGQSNQFTISSYDAESDKWVKRMVVGSNFSTVVPYLGELWLSNGRNNECKVYNPEGGCLRDELLMDIRWKLMAVSSELPVLLCLDYYLNLNWMIKEKNYSDKGLLLNEFGIKSGMYAITF